MENNAFIKDITFLVFTVVSEFVGDFFGCFKLTEEITIGIRVLIGSLIHMIEMVIVFFADNALNTSKTFTPENGVNKHGLIITIFVLTLLLILISFAYIVWACFKRKRDNFDYLINKRKYRLLASLLKISTLLFLLFKAISIIVSVTLVANLIGVNDKSNDKFEAYFAAYSSIDLTITICVLIIESFRFLFMDIFCYKKFYKTKVGIEYIKKNNENVVCFDANRAIKWHSLWHEFEKEKHEFDVLYHETYANFCLSTLACWFMFFSIPGKIYAKKAYLSKQNIECGENVEKSLRRFQNYRKKTKIFNIIFKTANILFIFSAAFGVALYVAGGLFKPDIECSDGVEFFGSGGDDGFELNPSEISTVYIEINSTKKPVKCEKQWLKIMDKNDYSLDEYQRYAYDFNGIYSSYLNGFGFGYKNNWMSLNDMNFLTQKRNRKLRIAFGNETFTDYIEFSSFKVGTTAESFKLELGAMSKSTFKNVPDWSSYHNGMSFQVNRTSKCSSKWRSGWWFNDCFGICATCFNGTLYDSINKLHYFKRVKMLINNARRLKGNLMAIGLFLNQFLLKF